MNSWWQDAENTLTNQSAKPLIVFLFDPMHKFAKPLVNNIMCSSALGGFLNKNFLCFGMLKDSKERKDIDRIVKNAEIPFIVILRKDKLENIEVLGENLFTFGQASSINAATVEPHFKKAVEQYKTARTADKTFINDFEKKKMERQQWVAQQQQMNMGGFFGNQDYNYMGFENLQRNEPQLNVNQNSNTNVTNNANSNPDAMSDEDLRRMQDRMMREEQDRQYQEMIDKQLREEQEKQEELEKLRRQMSDEKKAVQAKENKKETIEKNLPAEPETGSEGCFTCVVRLPSGARINRNFLKSHKLQMLHDYIFIQEDKGFENNDCPFELMTGYPPKPITNYEQTFGEFSQKPKELFVLKEKTD